MWSLLARLLVAGVRGAVVAAGRLATRSAAVSLQVARFGRIAFVGLINNRPLASLGQQEIRNAFAKVGLREAHNSHFISRLIARGPNFGISTLDDFARAINNGAARAGRSAGTVEIVIPNGKAAVVINQLGELITFLPL